MAEQKDIRATRVHPVLQDRCWQISTNISAVKGGKPYIEARLHRHPCESDASWSGQTAGISKQPGVNGRKDRAYLPAVARRITSKICQYVFGQPIAREGIDEDFKRDADRNGRPLNDLMSDASVLLDACGWAWIQVDRDPLPTNETGETRQRSIAEKERSRDRVYWRIWSPVDVVDWCVDSAGRIVWLMTQGEVFTNEDPAKPATCQKIRTLYIPGGGLRLFLNPDKPEVVDRIEPFTNSAKEVPFILVGVPSKEPTVFDDIERYQAALLNYASAHQENLLKTVFAQLVIPSDMPQAISSAFGAQGGETAQLVMGLGFPILESNESKGLSRYMVPPSDGLKMIPEEMNRLQRELFELVGMMLSKDTKQAESAEAKAWDRLDPQAVLSARAQTLEESEKRAIDISLQLDSGFKKYVPVYPTAFDIGDVKADFESLLTLDALGMPDEARREMMRAGVHLLGKIRKIEPANLKVIQSEIDAHEFGAEMDAALALAAAGKPKQVETPVES